MRPRLAVILAVALLALAAAAVPRPPLRAQGVPPVTCGELRDLGLTVVLSDRDLLGGDETGFCLVAREPEDTYIGYIPNVTTTEAFRTGKTRYGAAMQRQGYDICRLGAWRPLNREGDAPVPLATADRLDAPGGPCAPRFVARDPNAATWLDQVTPLLTTIADRSAADLGFVSRRPLTVDLYTDAVAARDAFLAARPELDPAAAAAVADQGRSLTVLSPTRGMFMIVNLTDHPSRATLSRRLAHEYTHFMQASWAGTLDAYPQWFLEGQAEFQMERLAGLDWDRRADAARRERAGAAPHLADLATIEAWTAGEQRAGNGVYSRGYSAISYVAENWGFDAIVQLMRAVIEGDSGTFDRALRAITGMDVTALDAALAGWLRALGGRLTLYNDSPLGMQLVLPGGREFSLPPCASCTFHRDVAACAIDGRPSLQIDVPAGDVRVIRIVPNDRIHFPDTTLTYQLDPGAVVSQCLELRP